MVKILLISLVSQFLFTSEETQNSTYYYLITNQIDLCLYCNKQPEYLQARSFLSGTMNPSLVYQVIYYLINSKKYFQNNLMILVFIVLFLTLFVSFWDKFVVKKGFAINGFTQLQEQTWFLNMECRGRQAVPPSLWSLRSQQQRS